MSPPARADDTTVGPGGNLTLSQDLVLQAGDNLVAVGTADNPCTIEGNSHQISTIDSWQGRFEIRFCNIHGLGRADLLAMNVRASGASTIALEGDTMDASGGVYAYAVDTTTVQILRNTVLDTSLVPVPFNSAVNTVSAMQFEGYANTIPKVFQGNRVFRSQVTFNRVQNWLVGGTGPGEGNVIVGTRGGISVDGSDIRIVGNYLRASGDLNGWNQVKTLALLGSGIVVEHNLIRDGNWLVDVLGDVDLRYNLLGDSHDRPWLIFEQADASRKVHHNVFMRNAPQFDVNGVWVLQGDTSTQRSEIYNNTFDGGGKCWYHTGPAVVVEPDARLDSLSSNAFYGFATNLGPDTAMVRGGGVERGPAPGTPVNEPKDPPLERLGYADYNLFDDPTADVRDNYALAVPGKRERMDDGFALHDAPAGGAVDAQVDPMFAGGTGIPVSFPYDDEDIKAGKVTVCQILAFYRSLFAPADGSPLIGTGDPATVTGNNIGAIGGGAGPGQGDDLFGTLCAAGDFGSPNLSPEAFKCPPPPPSTTTTTGISGRGFVCVCDQAAAPSGRETLASLAAVFMMVTAVLCVRRRERQDGKVRAASRHK